MGIKMAENLEMLKIFPSFHNTNTVIDASCDLFHNLSELALSQQILVHGDAGLKDSFLFLFLFLLGGGGGGGGHGVQSLKP